MRAALIGHTGFVGGNLAQQHQFQEFFNSRNIEQIAGREFDMVVCSGMPAGKSLANQDPATDVANLQRLWTNLQQVRTERLILISTVDVYPNPVGVDESSEIELNQLLPYGKHRRQLELAVDAQFPTSMIVRLPGLFGQGLRTNAVYDLINNSQVEQIPPFAEFQFYNLDRLWHDLTQAELAGLNLVNFATEPVQMQEIAKRIFGRELTGGTGTPPRYDCRSEFAEILGGSGPYLADRATVLSEMAEFVAGSRRAA